MALIKQTKDKDSHTLVTFTIENHETLNSSHILLLGDFNDWQSNDNTYQMEKEGDSYVKRVKLKNGKRYEFRYLSESNGWFNDNAADDYISSPYEGIQNSVVDLNIIPKKKKSRKTKNDDLKKIEGIGPKIASILISKNIDTFKKLSEAPVNILENILKNAGPRFSMHKPNSWPNQAKLAYGGKWNELKQLQDKLDGGR